ncbi:MAG TPA: F0F1 ATP synthase subunit epsilon [Chloroflexi bacterium]|nr:F0F1 ATP synthase subunit epsilon [Chloroflexota bacterium]
MAKISFELVTPARVVHSDDAVDMVIAPGVDGLLGILPSHAPLLAALGIGELRLKKGDDEESFAVHGGFVEVLANKVIVMAYSAERAEEIDVTRAEEARERAEQRAREKPEGLDMGRLQAALRRSRVRLKVARQRRRRPRMEMERDER